MRWLCRSLAAAAAALLSTVAAAADDVPRVKMTAEAWAAATLPAAGPAESIGGYAAGCMSGAMALPVDGPGYQVLRPSRRRNFGQPELVKFIQELGQRAQSRGLGILQIADMSQPRGGPMPNGHASHQIGLDVDIWLRLDRPRMPTAERENPVAISVVDFASVTVDDKVWTPEQGALIRMAAEDNRVARLFVNPAIKEKLCRTLAPADRGWLHKVRPWWGHAAHTHVRLACPHGDGACDDQKPPPPGDGCDEELDSWLADMRKPKTPKEPSGPAKPRVVALPRACVDVLHAKGKPVSAAMNMPMELPTTLR